MLARERATGGTRSGMSPSHDWEPPCGWFRTRFVKGGPPVPVRITIDRDIDPATGELTRDETFIYEIDGQRRRSLPIGLVYHAITREAFDEIMAARAADLRLQATLVPFDFVAAGPPRPTRP